MNVAATGGATAAAAIAQAIKASGAIVSLEPEDFQRILEREEAPLVVRAKGGFLGNFFGNSYQYLTAYKGLVFFTKSPEPIPLAGGCEVVQARKIWIPG